nr:hypothetical protein [Tanacetum cinerariifolium]
MRPVPPSPDRTPALYVYPLNSGNDSSDEDLSDTTKSLHTQSASTLVVHTSPTQSLPTSLVLVNQPKNRIPMPLGYKSSHEPIESCTIIYRYPLLSSELPSSSRKRSRPLSPSIPPSVPPPPPSVPPPEHIESLGDNIKASIWNLERRTGSICVVPVKFPEVSPEHLPEISSGGLLAFGSDHRYAPLSGCVSSFYRLLFLPSLSYFLLTSDVVKTLVADYAIPLDLHLCVPSSGLTMNRLPADKIGVRVGKGVALTANEVIPQHITLPLPSGSQIPEKFDHQKVGEYENERVLAAKRKARATKDWADGKRAATEGASQRPKKKKTSHLSFAMLDSEADGSPRSGFGTHHSVSPLNTIIPNEAELTTEGDDLILESVNRAKEDADRHLDHVKDTTEVNFPLFEHLVLNTLTPPMRMHIT